MLATVVGIFFLTSVKLAVYKPKAKKGHNHTYQNLLSCVIGYYDTRAIIFNYPLQTLTAGYNVHIKNIDCVL